MPTEEGQGIEAGPKIFGHYTEPKTVQLVRWDHPECARCRTTGRVCDRGHMQGSPADILTARNLDIGSRPCSVIGMDTNGRHYHYIGPGSNGIGLNSPSTVPQDQTQLLALFLESYIPRNSAQSLRTRQTALSWYEDLPQYLGRDFRSPMVMMTFFSPKMFTNSRRAASRSRSVGHGDIYYRDIKHLRLHRTLSLTSTSPSHSCNPRDTGNPHASTTTAFCSNVAAKRVAYIGRLLRAFQSATQSPNETQPSRRQSSRPHTASTSQCAKPRTSWVFSHMSAQDIETRYYNQWTGKEEWPCKHCDVLGDCGSGQAPFL